MTSKPAREQSSAAFINQATIEIEAPAKLNLFLRITGKRANGYHEIESLFVPVALYDNLKISIIEEGIEASCSGRKLPEGQNNLVNRAAFSFLEETRISKGAKISLIKRIPISSGLGGGSSDAAATLRGLNILWGNPLSKRDLERLALSLGADVPFFLLQRPAVARGIGEILEPIKNFPDLWYAIVSPNLMVSTAWAYKRARLELTAGGNQNIINYFDGAALNIPDLLFNDLESVTLSKYPFLSSIKASLKALGALGALMTGSGPSVFGVFDSEKRAHEAGKRLLRQWRRDDVFVVKGLS
jgi:4-diphosphocytidyl-2-C-methyl-D-erythritol kinase